METDFTSLDQWEREYFLYTKMMEIPFFKKYRRFAGPGSILGVFTRFFAVVNRRWKAFYFWKKLVRREKYSEWGNFLTVRLACVAKSRTHAISL